MKRVILFLVASLSLANADKINFSKEKNVLYQKECGSCHFAYQAEFLGRDSWDKMLKNLSSHFGTDASLEQKDIDTLREYLLRNSGKNSGDIQKITELRWFKKEHREIPDRIIIQKDVGSLGNCTACHRDAQKDDFRERGINIPNYGKWED